MKKIIVLVLAAVLSVSMLALLTACGGKSSIENITVSTQENGSGVEYKNYQVKLKESVDWLALSEDEREKIATTGFEEAQKKIAEDEVRNYNIIGIGGDNTVAFQFDAEHNTLIILADNERTGEVAVEVNE
jgi:hypothetical protein